MLFSQWWSYLTGYLEIEIQGEALEPFINMAITRGILLWEIRRIDANKMLARVRISGFFGLRYIARRTRCRVKIRKRYGLPFFLAKMQRRIMLVIGSILFLVTLYFLASFIWVVNVIGVETLENQAILEAAAQHGLRPGVWRARIDLDLLERQLKEDFPQVSFISIYTRGTIAVIEVVEKVLPPEVENEKQPANLIARRDGLIEDIIVIAGEPRVKPGDTVKIGQCLISGVVMPYSNETQLPGVTPPPALENTPQYVHARGWVRARVWYEGYGDAYLIEEEEKESGAKVQQIQVTWGNKQVTLWGPRAIPYVSYRQEQVEREWTFPVGQKREITLPRLQLKRTTYYEVLKQVVELGKVKAIQTATERALRQVEQQKQPGSITLQEKIETIPVEDERQVRVRVRREALEDIVQDQYFTPR